MAPLSDAGIRQCDERDARIIANLGRRTFVETYGADTPVEQMERHLAEAFGMAKVRSELRNPESSFFLAEVGDAAAGFMKLNAGTAQTDFGDAAALEIESLYVLGEFQGRGIGGLLFEQALQEAEDAKARYLWLGVWERNPRGKAFWERMGFAQAGTHPFDFGGTRHIDLVMRRQLR